MRRLEFSFLGRALASRRGAIPILIAVGFSVVILTVGGIQRMSSRQISGDSSDQAVGNDLFYNSELTLIQALERDEMGLLAAGLSDKEQREKIAETFLVRSDVAKKEVERLQTSINGSVDSSLTGPLSDVWTSDESQLNSTERTNRTPTGYEGVRSFLIKSISFYNLAGSSTRSFARKYIEKSLGKNPTNAEIDTYVTKAIGSHSSTLDEHLRREMADLHEDHPRVLKRLVADLFVRHIFPNHTIDDVIAGNSMTTAEKAEFDDLVAQMSQGKMYSRQAMAKIVASDSYFNAAGGTNQGWVQKMHTAFLGKSADAREAKLWIPQTVNAKGQFDADPDPSISGRHPATWFAYSKTDTSNASYLCGHSGVDRTDGTDFDGRLCVTQLKTPSCHLSVNTTLVDQGQDIVVTMAVSGATPDAAEINGTSISTSGGSHTLTGVSADGWATGSITLGASTYTCAPIRYHVSEESQSCTASVDSASVSTNDPVVRSISVSGMADEITLETFDSSNTLVDSYSSHTSPDLDPIMGGSLPAYSTATSDTYTVVGTVSNGAGSATCSTTFTVSNGGGGAGNNDPCTTCPSEVTIDCGSSMDRCYVTGAQLLSDGKILIGGYGHKPNALRYFTMRLNRDFTKDTTYGTNGIRRLNLAGSPTGKASDLVIDANERSYVIGWPLHTQGGSAWWHFGVASFTAGGGVRNGYSSDGKSYTNVRNSHHDSAHAAAIHPNNNRLVLGGTSASTVPNTPARAALVRIRPNGNLDGSFGGGRRTYSQLSHINALQVLPNGKTIAAGFIESGPNIRPGVIRTRGNGAIDPAFGNSGARILNTSNNETPKDLTVQANGRILVVGHQSLSNPLNQRAHVFRLRRNGNRDNSFDNDGQIYFPQARYGCSVAEQSDNKILVAGAHSGKVVLIRRNSDGSSDSSFNGTGTASTPNVVGHSTIMCGLSRKGMKVLVEPSGDIIVATTRRIGISGNNYKIWLGRWHEDGSTP